MHNKAIIFDKIAWQETAKGTRQKVYSEGNSQLRILQFNEHYVEDDWCLKAHKGFVLNGEMNVDFDGVTEHYKKGDGLWINPGEASKHKVIIEKGKMVELMLFELLS